MKKILGLLLAMILAIGMCGCETVESMNASTATEATTEASTEEDSDIEYYTLGDIAFPIPSTWSLVKSEENDTYYFCPTNDTNDKSPILIAQIISLNNPVSLSRKEANSIFDEMFKGLNSSGMAINTKKDLNGYSAYPSKYITGTEEVNDTYYNFESYITLYNTNAYAFYLLTPKGNENTYSDDIDQIVAVQLLIIMNLKIPMMTMIIMMTVIITMTAVMIWNMRTTMQRWKKMKPFLINPFLTTIHKSLKMLLQD